ncbi:unnamed protein product [Allacma fusca]|uniref:KN motif and ankyrin repeat domain-containing protein 1 n=1 Tax=Allacma fusca TaxID=39272 RepID=A0A8J2JT85_9HEXA|nr:unnamed protein product [Allacma fusca]
MPVEEKVVSHGRFLMTCSVLNGTKEMERCSCCPYGYHIDRDFVPFTKKMLSREANVDRLRELRSKLRSQRKSMDKLLGVPKLVSVSPTWEVETLSRASVDVWRSDLRREREKNHHSGYEAPVQVEKLTQSIEDSFGLESSLQAAVKDFEDALNRTRPLQRTLNYEIPDSQKFHTFPRIKPPVKELQFDGNLLIMRNKESRPSIRNLTNKMEGSLLSEYVPPSSYLRQSTFNSSHETNGESILSKKEPVEIVSNRIRDLEDQVKMIPELQVKVTLLTEEKRQIMKLLENEKLKRARVEEIYESLKSSLPNGHLGDVNQNVVPFEKSPKKDTSIGKSVLTRDVGSSPNNPTLRSIAVGENVSIFDRSQPLNRSDASSPTGSIVGSLRRRVRSFDTGVQVTELDLGIKTSDPLLQIVEKVDCGTQSVDEGGSLTPKAVKTKTIGIHAKPRMIEVGVLSKPKLRDATINTTEIRPEKPRCKHVGVGVNLDSPVIPAKTSETLNLEVSRTSKVTTTTSVEDSPQSLMEFTTPKMNSSSSFTVLKQGRRQISNLPAIGDSQQIGSRRSTSPLQNIDSSFVPPSPTEQKPPSRIPRLATPTTSPTTSPKPFIKSAESSVAENLHSSRSAGYKPVVAKSPVKPPPLKRQNTYTKEYHGDKSPEEDADSTVQQSGSESSEEEEQVVTSRMSAHECSPIEEAQEREKVTPSKEMLAALKVLNDALLRGRTTQQVTAAISIILHEWFRVAGTKSADPGDVEDYLDTFESFSPQLLRYIVNMPDGNGNTSMHYAVSHGNFDVVSILLDSKVCDPNKANKAGYTSVMLVSLAKILSDTHRQVVRRLFSLGDVNIKAAQHGQTALMLAASHGRLDTVRLLLEAGADINIQDEDGSTALMCASEHGHGEIVKYFLTQSDCDPHITDNDGSTALSVSMEAGHKDIGVMLYAHMHFVSPNASTSPGSMRAKKSRTIFYALSERYCPVKATCLEDVLLNNVNVISSHSTDARRFHLVCPLLGSSQECFQ